MESNSPIASAELFLLSAWADRHTVMHRAALENTLNKTQPLGLTLDRGGDLSEVGKVNIEVGEKHLLHKVLCSTDGKDLRPKLEKCRLNV